MLLARMASGALGTIEATKIATGSEDELRLEIHGSRGALRYNSMDPHHLDWYDAALPSQPLGGFAAGPASTPAAAILRPPRAFPSVKSAIGWTAGHVACLADFLAAVAAGRPAAPGLDQGIRVQRLMDLARRSAAEERWVKAGPPMRARLSW